ncbi:MAG: GGDEF domain-containing protein [Actinobacteria bacterium]|nr:GGDEF domain-containing protein [Actinomycetota bacterium]
MTSHLLRAALAASPDGLSIHRRGAGQRGTAQTYELVWCNPAAADVLVEAQSLRRRPGAAPDRSSFDLEVLLRRTERAGAPQHVIAEMGAAGARFTVVAVPIDGPHLLVSWHSPGRSAPHLRTIETGDQRPSLDADREVQGVRATTPALDGLPDRTALLAHLQTTLAACPQNRWVAVIGCDVDPLKSVSATMGHECRDAVLSSVANRLHHHVGRRAFAARITWDEIALVLPSVARSWSAAAFLRDLREAITEPLEVRGQVVRPTVSFGLHLAGGSRRAAQTDAEAVLDTTVRDMYRSRRAVVLQDAVREAGGSRSASIDEP